MILCHVDIKKLLKTFHLNNWSWSVTPIYLDRNQYFLDMKFFKNGQVIKEEKLSWTYLPKTSPNSLAITYIENFLK